MSGNPIFAVLWGVLLFFIAWPVAGICAGLWLLLVRRATDWRASSLAARPGESRYQEIMAMLKLMPAKPNVRRACGLHLIHFVFFR